MGEESDVFVFWVFLGWVWFGRKFNFLLLVLGNVWKVRVFVESIFLVYGDVVELVLVSIY